MTIKTLTLTQPWATLAAIGAKRIETRSWKTNYRGPLAIHAAKGFPKWARFACLLTPFEAALRDGGYNSPNELPIGQVVAVAQLVNVYKIEPLVTSWRWQGSDGRRYEYELTPSERAFGQYNPGRYAWMLADIRRLAEPVPARGSLGLWEIELPEENTQSLRKQPD